METLIRKYGMPAQGNVIRALGRKEILSHAVTRINLENPVLSASRRKSHRTNSASSREVQIISTLRFLDNKLVKIQEGGKKKELWRNRSALGSNGSGEAAGSVITTENCLFWTRIPLNPTWEKIHTNTHRHEETNR
jgi:hypothetical protein